MNIRCWFRRCRHADLEVRHGHPDFVSWISRCERCGRHYLVTQFGYRRFLSEKQMARSRWAYRSFRAVTRSFLERESSKCK